MIGKALEFIFDRSAGQALVAALAAVALFTGWLWRHDAKVAERVETKIITNAKETGKVPMPNLAKPIVLLASLVLMGGCATQYAVIATDELCRSWRHQTVSRNDRLTDDTASQNLGSGTLWLHSRVTAFN